MLSKPEMTLRDYFAGQAIVGILAREPTLKTIKMYPFYALNVYAQPAYTIADAMLREREMEQPEYKPAKKAEMPEIA